MADLSDPAVGTDWQALILSTLIPGTIAAGFIYLAQLPDWQPSDTWMLGIAFLFPLDFVRALVLALLGESYKISQGRWQAVQSFLLSMAILLGLGIFYAITQGGIKETFGFLTDPTVLELFGLPILIMVIDGVIGIWAFRGDPIRQADRLQAIAEDTIDWLVLSVGRVPLMIAPIYALLAWMKSDAYGIAAWVPDPSLDLLRGAGLFYAAWYFLGKAALMANVYTAHFARTGKRLLAATWIQWIVGNSKKPDAKRQRAARYKPPVKSVLAFEDKMIQSIKENSTPGNSQEKADPQ
jgi:hypothetical protein